MDLRLKLGAEASGIELVSEAWRIATGEDVEWESICDLPIESCPQFIDRLNDVLSAVWGGDFVFDPCTPQTEVGAVARHMSTFALSVGMGRMVRPA